MERARIFLASSGTTDPFDRNKLTPGGIRQAEQIGKNLGKYVDLSSVRTIRLPYFGARKTAELAVPSCVPLRPESIAEAVFSMRRMLSDSSLSVLIVSSIDEIPLLTGQILNEPVDRKFFHHRACVLLGIDEAEQRIIDLSDGICQILETL